MSHLNEIGYTYFQHLFRAWKIAFILIVHGVFPDIWKTRASDELCKERLGDDATREFFLNNMHSEKKQFEKTPSIWDRMSDRELAIMQAKNKK